MRKLLLIIGFLFCLAFTAKGNALFQRAAEKSIRLDGRLNAYEITLTTYNVP